MKCSIGGWCCSCRKNEATIIFPIFGRMFCVCSRCLHGAAKERKEKVYGPFIKSLSTLFVRIRRNGF